MNDLLRGHFNLSKAQTPTTENEKVLMSEVPNASTVGSVIYVMLCTRSNIAQAVGVVSKYMSNLRKEHWK